ncbi:MAG: hypothetical protein ACETWM_09990 [Candidatus Lokiarchaeia archaeon]
MTFNSEFDVVFPNATLHWIFDHISVLKGTKRVLYMRSPSPSRVSCTTTLL